MNGHVETLQFENPSRDLTPVLRRSVDRQSKPEKLISEQMSSSVIQ